MKKSTRRMSIMEIVSEIVSLRQRMTMLDIVRRELRALLQPRTEEGPEYIEVRRDHWEPADRHVLDKLDLELGLLWKAAADRCRELEALMVEV